MGALLTISPAPTKPVGMIGCVVSIHPSITTEGRTSLEGVVDGRLGSTLAVGLFPLVPGG